MKKTLWYVRSTSVSERAKEIGHWEWEKSILVQQVLARLLHDTHKHQDKPFPLPFQIAVEEEVTGGHIRVLATVFVEVEK